MSDHLTPFTAEHLEPAIALFVEDYRQERVHSPLLPTRAIDDPAWIRDALSACLDNPSVAVIQNDRLVAYMVSGAQFPWKGQRAPRSRRNMVTARLSRTKSACIN